MPTECSPALFDFAAVESRRVVAGFDGGAITSNAGALLLGATGRAIGLVRRFAACFRDARAPERIEHEVATLVGQRVFGIALGHEGLCTARGWWDTWLPPMRREPRLKAGPAGRRWAVCSRAARSARSRCRFRGPRVAPGAALR